MIARLAAQTTEKVDSGTEAADKTARALDLVVKGTEVIGTMVDRISGASVRQADSIIQIRQSMEMVSEIVQEIPQRRRSATSVKNCRRRRRY